MELPVFDRAAASWDLWHFWISEYRLVRAPAQGKRVSIISRDLTWVWGPGSRRLQPSLASCSSAGLPDHIEDLDHLLVDDENYGNVQADAAETWDCSFIEATDWPKDRNRQKTNVTAKRDNKHMQLSISKGGTKVCLLVILTLPSLHISLSLKHNPMCFYIYGLPDPW